LLPDIELADMRRLYDIFKGNVRAMLNYGPRAVRCGVTLLTASEGISSSGHDHVRGWDDFAAAIEVYPLPGNHFTMMREPHVKALAARLGESLAAASPQYGVRPAGTAPQSRPSAEPALRQN
jgi:thioesterase domain-containing protein